MTNQIETTLQKAIDLCEKNGGIFYERENQDDKWCIGTRGQVCEIYTGEDFALHKDDHKKIWIYEPPKKSAFQEWEEKQNDEMPHEAFRNSRKEGWNAFSEACEEIAKEGNKDYVSLSTIRELKEP